MASKRLAVMDAILRRFRAGFGGASELGVLEGDASGYLWHTQPHVTTATRLGDRFMAVDDSSTDDSTVTMSATDCRDVLMKGSAINRWHVLPDATSLTAGTVVFVFSNWSSEIRGVRNSDSTLWLRILPSQTATVWLVTGGTAAGVWGAELSQIHPDYGFENVEDFVTGSATGWYTKSGLYGAGAGTGATARVIAVYSTHATNPMGIGELYSGTDTDSEAYFCWYTSGLTAGFGFPLRCFASRVRLAVGSDGTNTYVFRVGFGDSYTAAKNNDGAWFEYDSTTSAKWMICAAGAGDVTRMGTAGADVAFNTTLYDLNVEISSAATRADFWINRVFVGTISDANVPQALETFGVVHILANVAGEANNRRVSMDSTGVAGSMSTRRS
jgi:hypothetical protein